MTLSYLYWPFTAHQEKRIETLLVHPAGPRHSRAGSLLGPSALCSPAAPLSSPPGTSACLVPLPEQLSYTYKSALQFHFQSSLLPALALNLTLHKSISKGAGEQRKSAPFALVGQSWAARDKRCGAGAGSLSPATACPLCKPRGTGGAQGEKAGTHYWRAGVGRSHAQS